MFICSLVDWVVILGPGEEDTSLYFCRVFIFISVNILCCFLFYRDAVSDLALHFLNKMKILVVRDIERDEIEFICKVSEPCGAKEFIQAIQGKIVTNSRKMQPKNSILKFVEVIGKVVHIFVSRFLCESVY